MLTLPLHLCPTLALLGQLPSGWPLLLTDDVPVDSTDPESELTKIGTRGICVGRYSDRPVAVYLHNEEMFSGVLKLENVGLIVDVVSRDEASRGERDGGYDLARLIARHYRLDTMCGVAWQFDVDPSDNEAIFILYGTTSEGAIIAIGFGSNESHNNPPGEMTIYSVPTLADLDQTSRTADRSALIEIARKLGWVR